MPAPLVELYIETGNNAGQVHAFAPGQHELTLGRSEPGGRQSPDLSFDDVGAAHSLLVSRHHLRIRIDQNGAYVMDLGSRNGTEVDGGMLVPNVEVPLRVGARIHLAPPEGPTIMVRERLASLGWSSPHEELELWQKRYEELSANYKQLQDSHHALVNKLQAQDVQLPQGADVDWSRCQGKLLDSLERLTFVSQLLVDASVDVKVHGYLQRVVSNLNDLQTLLRLNVK